MPIVIFLAVMFTVLSCVFLLENMRPRILVVQDGPAALEQVLRTETENPRDRAKYSA